MPAMAKKTGKTTGARGRAVATEKKRVVAKKTTKVAAATKTSSPAKKAAQKTAKKAPAKKAPKAKEEAKKTARKPRKAPEPKARAVAADKKTVRAKGSGSGAVDGYVERLEGWQRGVIAAIRSLIARAAPEATETVKWGQPVFEQGGPFAYVRPAASHVTFGFWRGAELDDPARVLEGSGDRMRHVKLTEPAEVDAEILAPFVRQAVELNRRHGNPAAVRRGR